MIRISGPEAVVVADRVFTGSVLDYKSHTAHFGRVVDGEGRHVDEVLLLVMRGPRSYTGEDTVEIQCHGGMVVQRRVLEVVLEAGARLALPGEFTFKAFMNGKLDLAQAEAVGRLIGARSDLASRQASAHLEGALSRTILALQKELTEIAAVIEAWVDFPEEGLEFATQEELIARLEDVQSRMGKLALSFHEGKRIHEGVATCLVGSPNVGKSSLLNALLQKERAIVSSIPGTTRDLLEEDFVYRGLRFRLSDTAGMRQTEEEVERLGIERTHRALEAADLVLFVLDATRPLNSEERALCERLPAQKTIGIWNKLDLCEPKEPLPFPHVVALSALEGRGVEQLLEKMFERVWGEGMGRGEELVLFSARHKEALLEACKGCRRVIEGLQEGVSAEFLAFDLRQALTELTTILGANVTEEILSSIFSQFCVGK